MSQRMIRRKKSNKLNRQDLFDDEELFDDFPLSIEPDLKKKGVYYITGPISSGSLTSIHQDILLKYLSPDWKDELYLFINSVGGELSEGWALIDLLDYTGLTVNTIGMGEICSLGTILVAAGTKGHRTFMPNSLVMAHTLRYTGFIDGTPRELESLTKSTSIWADRLMKFWLQRSNCKSKEEVDKHLLSPVDNYMTAEEAVRFGIADKVFGQEKPDTPPKSKTKSILRIQNVKKRV